jgi:hypothetical protein
MHRRPDSGLSYAFPVTADAPRPGKVAAPAVHWTTWLTGSLETLLVAFMLFSSFRILRRFAVDRTTILRTDGTPEADFDLLDV